MLAIQIQLSAMASSTQNEQNIFQPDAHNVFNVLQT